MLSTLFILSLILAIVVTVWFLKIETEFSKETEKPLRYDMQTQDTNIFKLKDQHDNTN